jgi:DNA replication protein DnaC
MRGKPKYFRNFNWDMVKLFKVLIVDGKIESEPADSKIITGFHDSNFTTIILSANTGRGKTHLGCAILNEFKSLYKSSECTEFIKATELYTIFFDAQPQQEERYTAAADLKYLSRKSIILIDDLGVEKQTESGVFNEGFMKFLENYYGKLVITTNLDVKRMIPRYGKKIFSRLMENALYIIIEGGDYRLTNLYGQPLENDIPVKIPGVELQED